MAEEAGCSKLTINNLRGNFFLFISVELGKCEFQIADCVWYGILKLWKSNGYDPGELAVNDMQEKHIIASKNFWSF
jgi:hypothetical protein